MCGKERSIVKDATSLTAGSVSNSFANNTKPADRNPGGGLSSATAERLISSIIHLCRLHGAASRGFSTPRDNEKAAETFGGFFTL